MDTQRPFSGPVSVTVAGLTLVGLAAGSFATGLSHQLRLYRPSSALQAAAAPAPRPAPPPAASPVVAEAAPAPPEPAPRAHRRRRVVRLPDLPPFALPSDPQAAASEGVDASVVEPPPDETPPAGPLPQGTPPDQPPPEESPPGGP